MGLVYQARRPKGVGEMGLRVMYMNADKPLLTLSQVRDWQDQIGQLTEEIRVKNVELANLTRKVEAAKAFIASLEDDEQMSVQTTDVAGAGSEPSPVAEGGAESSTDAPTDTSDDSISGCILAAVTAVGGMPKPAVIRRWIAKNNPAVDAKLTAHPAYLYTALARHVQRRRLAKRGKGYCLPTSFPRGKAGGVAPPAPIVTPDDKGAVASGTEAGGT